MLLFQKELKFQLKKTENYVTSSDYQELMSIGIYEGEKKYVKDNHLLGEFRLKDLPKKPKGDVEAKVTFNIDSNGILTVSAVETSKGITNSIKIINDKEFNEKEIIDNINNNYIPLINENNKEIINFKKEMNDYYKYYLE